MFAFAMMAFFTREANALENHINAENNLRRAQLNGYIDSKISFTLRPLELNNYKLDDSIFDYKNYAPTVLSFFNESGSTSQTVEARTRMPLE